MGVMELCRSMDAALRPTNARIIAVGAMDIENTSTSVSPVDHATDRFEIGSITKVATGTVLARLVLDGLVALDAPIDDWLDAGRNSSITLGQLATHTSGLPRLAPNACDHDGFDPANPYARYDALMAEAGLRDAESTKVGTYAYSNFGYQLLGMCLERASGKRLSDLFAEIVFEPAGMGGATADPDLPVLQGDDDSGPVANWTVLLQGPGGINATIDDLVALVAAVLRPRDERLAEALSFALEPRAAGPGAQLGLGWALHPAGIACSGGGTAGFSTYIAAHRGNGLGVAVAINRSASESIQAIALAAAQGHDPAAVIPAAFEDDPIPWSQRAEELFRSLASLDFEAARALMRPETAQSLTAERLRAGWSQIAGSCGELGEPRVTDIARARGAVEVTVVAPGSVKPLTLRTWLDEKHRVAGVTVQ